MKILFLKDQRSKSGNEGTAKIVLSRCIELNKRNIDYLVLYHAKDKFYRTMLKNDIRVKYLPFPKKSPKYIFHKRFIILKFRKKIKKIIEMNKITHIHVFHSYLLDFLEKKWGLKITADCYEAFQNNEKFRVFFSNLFLGPRLFIRSIYEKLIVNNYEKASIVIAASKAAKKTLIKKYGVKKEKVKILYNGVDELKILDDKNKKIRKKFNIGYSDKIILSVGRVSKAKGVEEFCEIAKSFKNKKNIKFVFVGGYLNKSYWKDILSKYQKFVIFPGEVDDVSSFYMISNIFLFLSRRESFGNVLVEAMQFHLPSIVWNITGLKEVIIDNHNGYCCPFGKIEYVKKKINHLLNNKIDYQKISHNAYIQKNEYSVKKNVDKFLYLLQN
jgi:glycosyltransferase involved in cell wall biosynthesis